MRVQLPDIWHSSCKHWGRFTEVSKMHFPFLSIAFLVIYFNTLLSFLIMYTYIHWCEGVCTWVQVPVPVRDVGSLLELESQAIVSCLKRVLLLQGEKRGGLQLRTFGRAVHASNHWTISPTLETFVEKEVKC